MHTKIYNSITEMDEDQWNSIVGRNRIICSYNFLLAVEKSNINDCEYLYPVILDNDKIVAHACVYSITTDLDTLATGFQKKIILLVRLIWKNFLKIKFLEFGTPIAIGNTMSFADNIDKEKALNLLVDCIENIAKVNKIGIVLLRDFYENEINFYNNLISRKYKRLNNLPNTILEIKWNSFNEYLNELRSHYRYKINKNIKIAKDKNIVIELCDNFSDIAENLQSLWKNVYDNAKEYKREILTKDFFININIYLQERSKVILLKKDSKIIGFNLLLSDDDTLRFMFTGIDYNYNNEFSVYFNSLYSIIHQAIVERKMDIDAGISTYLPKINVGAEMIDLYMYMKHTNKLLNPVITNLFSILTPKVKIKPHNVFKEKAGKKVFEEKTENKIKKKYSMIHT